MVFLFHGFKADTIWTKWNKVFLHAELYQLSSMALDTSYFKNIGNDETKYGWLSAKTYILPFISPNWM